MLRPNQEQRIVMAEHRELKWRTTELRYITQTEEFGQLPQTERMLQHRQLKAMETYLSVLDQRIEGF